MKEGSGDLSIEENRKILVVNYQNNQAKLYELD